MPIQLEMAKCRVCQTWFWHRYLKDSQCQLCLSVTKQEVTKQDPNKENQQAESNSNIKQG